MKLVCPVKPLELWHSLRLWSILTAHLHLSWLILLVYVCKISRRHKLETVHCSRLWQLRTNEYLIISLASAIISLIGGPEHFPDWGRPLPLFLYSASHSIKSYRQRYWEEMSPQELSASVTDDRYPWWRLALLSSHGQRRLASYDP